MRCGRHLVVFARAPRLGGVKTRLARDIGDVRAWRFYAGALERLLFDLGRGPWSCWLSVTPAAALARPSRLFGPAVRGWQVIGQGRGTLGERMARVMGGLPPGPAIIVGSDIPELKAAHVADGFARLGRADTVFGPAPDGGYWLVGARRRPALPDMFRDVRWSSRHALSDTIANLAGRYTHDLLPTLADVDDGPSWRAWRAARG